MAAGERTRETFDVLWRAACLERSALEFAGIPQLAHAYLEDARRLILGAAKQQGAAA